MTPRRTPATATPAPTRHLLLFVALAFGWSWALWGPRALVAQGVLSGWPSLPEVAAFGPTLAGLAMVYRDRGWEGLDDLGRRTLRSGSRRWLLVGVILFPMLNGAVIVLLGARGAALSVPWAGEPVVLPVAFIFIFLLGGPVQEEFGWRGYALEPLQARFGAVGGSVVLGGIWGLWHLPLFFIPTQTAYYNRPVWGLLVSVVLLSVLMTWVYNHTGGSLLAMLLMHTSFNWAHGMLPVLGTDLGSLGYLVGMALVTVVVVVYWGPRTLARTTDRPRVEPPDAEH